MQRPAWRRHGQRRTVMRQGQDRPRSRRAAAGALGLARRRDGRRPARGPRRATQSQAQRPAPRRAARRVRPRPAQPLRRVLRAWVAGRSSGGAKRGADARLGRSARPPTRETPARVRPPDRAEAGPAAWARELVRAGGKWVGRASSRRQGSPGVHATAARHGADPDCADAGGMNFTSAGVGKLEPLNDDRNPSNGRKRPGLSRPDNRRRWCVRGRRRSVPA